MHPRSLFAASAIGLSILCIAGFANAQQIYKWKDASGVMHFSQTPPANGAHYTRMHLSSEPEVASQPASPADGTSDSDGRNPAAAPPPPAAQTTQADTPSNRATLCKQLSSNITLLQGKQPVVTAGDNGKQQVMGDSARQQQLATSRAQQLQYCSSMNR
ncbi:MAG TPA: DUF4124 domain-containing protein [Rhodanobacteraceae bacterium]|nr:DUF4124 domain-containing protein [Rhodanobacteraceae bacterium]